MSHKISSITVESDLVLVTSTITGNSGNVLNLPDWGNTTLIGTLEPATIQNKIIDCFENFVANVDNDAIKPNAAIDCLKIGYGTVSNTKLDCISDVMAPVQAQIDAKVIPISYINIGISEKTKNTTYTTQTKFVFPGTNYVVPIAFKCVAEMDDNTIAAQTRIFHKDSGNVICESPSFSGAEQIVNYGNISNLPPEESILEVQLRLTTASGSKFAWMHAVNIYYLNQIY